MSSEVAASQSQSTKKVQTNLSKALKWAGRLIHTLFAITAGIIQSYRAAGSVVAAGGAIVPIATATVNAKGNFKVTAWFSGTAPAGNVTPVVSAGPHSGLLVVQVSGEQDSTTQPKFSCVFIFASGGAPGSQWDFAMNTTVGDQNLTLGHGGVGNGAGLLVEELIN